MKKDISEKRLEAYNDVFADIYNALVFDGQEILSEETLTAMPTEAVTSRLDGGLRQGNRDIRKMDQYSGRYRLICGLENQTGQDNTMPERVMGYDYAAYEEQIRLLMAENKRDERPAYTKRIHDSQKLAPVITCVLYFGEEEWKGPLCLHDMLAFPPDIEEKIRPYVSDYPMHVIQVSRLTKEERERLKSDFRLVAEYLARKNGMGEFLETAEAKSWTIRHPAELMEVLYHLTNDKRLGDTAQWVKEMEKTEREAVKMGTCSFVDYFEEKGIEKGEKRINALCQRLISENRYEDLRRSVNDREFQKELLKAYGL